MDPIQFLLLFLESMMIQYIGDWCHMNDPWRYYTEDAQVDFYGIKVCFPALSVD